MSRTWKDVSYKFSEAERKRNKARDLEHAIYKEWHWEWVWMRECGYFYPKRKKNSCDRHEWQESHYLSKGPSWFRNLFMTRPYRRKMKRYEREVVKSRIEDVDLINIEDPDNKLYLYWW